MSESTFKALAILCLLGLCALPAQATSVHKPMQLQPSLRLGSSEDNLAMTLLYAQVQLEQQFMIRLMPVKSRHGADGGVPDVFPQQILYPLPEPDL